MKEGTDKGATTGKGETIENTPPRIEITIKEAQGIGTTRKVDIAMNSREGSIEAIKNVLTKERENTVR